MPNFGGILELESPTTNPVELELVMLDCEGRFNKEICKTCGVRNKCLYAKLIKGLEKEKR